MKKAIIFLLCFCAIFSCIAPIGAGALYNSSVDTQAKIFYLQSLDTGTVLFEKNSTQQTSPASLTKIVTAILAIENCEDLSTVITVPEYCIRALDGTGSSVVGLKGGEELTMKDLLYCLLVASANDAAMIIADYVGGGSIENFVGMMNDFAVEQGCSDSHFANPHGLDEDGHYSCAKDIATFAQYAMKYPVFTEITATTQYTVPATNIYKERTIRTTNFMMLSNYKEYYLAEAKGIKTGSTTLAGRCVVTTAAKNGYSYIAVVMNAPFYDYDKDGYDENFAFMDCKAMLSWTFDNIKLKTIAEPSQIISVVNVNYAWGIDHVRLVPAEESVALVPMGVDSASVLIEPVEKTVPKTIDAPIKKGDEVCEAVVSYAGEEIARIKLVAAEDVERSTVLFALGKIKAVCKTTGFKVFAALLVLIIIFLIIANIYVNRHRRRRKIRIINYRDVNSHR